MADRKLKLIVDMGGDAAAGLGNLAKGIAGLGVGVAVAGIAALGAGLAFSVGEAREAAAGQKELAATIQATGGVAGITVKAANDLAGSLAGVTNFTDDAVLAGENVLLTFTNIGKDIFPGATEAALDLAAKGFGTVDSASTMLGKALNDPIQGLSALQRVGVSFTEQEEEMIKKMAETGDMAGAQSAILQAIAAQGFGGAARAAADPITQLGNALAEAGETIGNTFLPFLTQLATGALPMVGQAMAAIQPALDTFTLFLGSLSEGNGIVTSIAAAMLNLGVSMDTVSAVTSLLSAALAGDLPAVWATIQPILAGWGTQFWDWLTGPGGAMEQAGAKMSQMATSLTTWVAGNSQLFSDIGSGIGSAILTGMGLITEGTEASTQMGTSFAGAIARGIVATASALGQIGAAMGQAVITGLIAKLTGGDVSAQMQGAITGAVSAFNPFAQVAAVGAGIQTIAATGGTGAGGNRAAQAAGAQSPLDPQMLSVLQGIQQGINKITGQPVQVNSTTTLNIDGATVADVVSKNLASQAQQSQGFGPQGRL